MNQFNFYGMLTSFLLLPVICELTHVTRTTDVTEQSALHRTDEPGTQTP